MIALRLIHILGAVFWAGSLIFSAVLVIPAIRASGPAGGKVMGHMVEVGRLPARLGGAAMLTILSGFALYWRDVSISAGTFAGSRAGMAYGLGAIAALLALGTVIAFVARSTDQIMKINGAVQAAGTPPTADQASAVARLQDRLVFGSQLGAALVGVTVITMAVGRYL